MRTQKAFAIVVMFILSAVLIAATRCFPKAEEVSASLNDGVPDNTLPNDTQGGKDKVNYSAKLPDADKIIEYNQYPDYPTGCECASLYILLKYYGVDVTMQKIVFNLPKGPVPYGFIEVLGADPYVEFVGDPTDERSYGVYNQPIADVANGFKDGAVAKYLGDGTKDGIASDIEDILDSGSPLIIWMKRSGADGEVKWKNYDKSSERQEIIWTKGEHAMVVYGYDDASFYCSDPMKGEKVSIDRDEFLTCVSAFDGMCVYYPSDN